MKFRITNHALEEIQKRKIPIALVEYVVDNPQQVLTQDKDIRIYQSQVNLGTGKLYLLRIFVNETIDPAAIVTVYRTSQIKKYWKI
ncbi:MAG: hypothetical protein DCF19_20490 [Pseudanabaena frigida]|uniref:DUF4258 domain-containing protein n=1 Tax=Pseudanabaena frigida TaxID=945775 RepID=A0A2W4W3V2_9CYAN|nr:MAG: hypothetical protein DCF19_20490 [Pseudanabaena frigida]